MQQVIDSLIDEHITDQAVYKDGMMYLLDDAVENLKEAIKTKLL